MNLALGRRRASCSVAHFCAAARLLLSNAASICKSTSPAAFQFASLKGRSSVIVNVTRPSCELWLAASQPQLLLPRPERKVESERPRSMVAIRSGFNCAQAHPWRRPIQLTGDERFALAPSSERHTMSLQFGATATLIYILTSSTRAPPRPTVTPVRGPLSWLIMEFD